jgi:hypothetical protein
MEMSLLSIVLLGIVEGLTEFLPVSSTGHLILAGEVMKVPQGTETFDIVIQLGAILAVVVLYRERFGAVLAGLGRRDPAAIRFTRNVLVGFLPSAVIGAVAYGAIKAMLNTPVIVAVALILGGIAILVIERLVRDPTAVGWYRSNPSASVQVQPLVSEALWKECNALLDSDNLGRRRGRRAIHLFAGFVLCHCGRRMYVRTHSQDYRCSACANRIAAADLEAIFVGQLEGYPPLATGEGAHVLHRCWPTLQPSEKRRVIEGLVDRIVVGQDDIEITLCAPPDTTAHHPQEPPTTDAKAVVPLTTDRAGRQPPDTPAEPRVDPVALAIALMKDHPEWSARKLAQAAGCSHTTLTRSPLFRTAKALAAANQSRPRGWRRSDGRIEARDEDA